MIRRLLVSAGAATAILLTIAGPVAAHIDPDPEQAQAGSRLTVGFTVEHGCEGSPTVQLDMRLPEGVVDSMPETVDGWDGSVDTIDGDTIVTFVGGPLADDVEGTFEVTTTLPPTLPVAASTENTAAPSTSAPVVISNGVDETAGTGTGTLIFIGTIAAVLAIGGFVVYRSRQTRAHDARNDS